MSSSRISEGTLFVVCLFLSSLAGAQNNSGAASKSVQALMIETAPVIDGILDEAVWAQATPITDFHQIRPGDQTPTSEATEVRIVYTKDAIYIAARMDDSNPELIASPTLRHGQGLGPDDRLIVILDPFNTRRTGYRFETNLNGVRHDALYTTVSDFDANWSTIWDVKTSTYENGWIAEIEIPFKSLPMDPTTEEWGFNFGRGIRRRNEEMAWVSFNRSFNPSIAGTLSGMRDMDQGVGLDIIPSLAVVQSKNHMAGTTDDQMNPSLDAFYRLTPSLNAALTINTDFSAVEVDSRQVNLDRFNLFFPERRDFFLNDADLFQFGNIGNVGNSADSDSAQQNARPYFSRKIGIGAGGTPVDIEYGGRISGRVGRWNIGTLAIQQDGLNDLDPSTLLISRVSANVLAESNVGFILTDGDPSSNLDNSVYGVDFRYLNTRLSSGMALEGDAWFMRSDTAGLEGDDASWGFGVRSPNNQGIRAGFNYKEVQENFNPAMGFVNNSGIRDYLANVGYSHFFKPGGLLQQAEFGFDAQRVNFIDGGLQTEKLRITLIEANTPNRDSFRIRLASNKEVVRAPFRVYSEPGRQVLIEPGRYEFTRGGFRLQTANQRPVSFFLGSGMGGFYNGDRTQVSSNIRIQGKKFIVTGSYEWNDITLPQGDFMTRLVSLNTQYAFTPNFYWVTLAQYDNISEVLGINTRLQWIPEAGQEAFIVLNYNLEDIDKDNEFQSMSTDLSVKFRYTFRF
ncbi:carbohydrate binding family 9 domain-containing protein [Gammaproteobacteria bacterium]|nr:carbohydrate binding family 9 domain-containing protein [Gammaproteobacteria bacterium]